MEQTTGAFMGIIIGLLIATAANGLIIWIVGKLGMGIEIDNFGTAFLAAFLSAIVGYLLHMLTASWSAGSSTNYGGIILHILGTALVLVIVSKMLSGMRIKGFFGAIVAAVAIGVIYWIIGMFIKA
jgi:putative membrane protein